ncbi:protein of unknown function [Thauera humireducens]|nr:protein of unknown function [Thauera humireducens]
MLTDAKMSHEQSNSAVRIWRRWICRAFLAAPHHIKWAEAPRNGACRRPVFVQNTKTFVTEPVLAGVAGGEGARDNGSDEGRQDLADASDNNIVIH